ncbi:E3 ubiquitin ligase BIG BROTHER-related-like [Silene latifolia]|uniref:E3 ubiquitin ligase BIG BROTHER-related-like n=1 Tax=Silene latifolia TaxID=37657 RepID=UPI003D785F13
MMASQPWLNQNFPPEVEENLADLFPDLSVEEALQHQESLYQSLKISCVNLTATSSDNEPRSSRGHSWGESSQSGSGDYDLALDEALARSLQEVDFDDEVEHVAISEPVHISSRNTEHAAGGTSVSAAEEDEVDPDQMTYEELQSLGESIGRENKGLSEREISSLPCFKYKVGLFSKRLDIAPCVICIAAFKNKDHVTTLPCAHKYHSDCIHSWLKLNKNCPICQKEIIFS